MKKSIAILGSTGSIGKSTLEVVRHLSDSIRVVALAAHSNIELLQEQIQEFHPEIVAVWCEEKAEELRRLKLPVKVVCGSEGVQQVACYSAVDFVVVAMVGMCALTPTVKAIEAGKGIGIANKEILVSAGKFITSLAKKKKVDLIPIDSEHSAIFQCLQGKKREEIHRVILTASGGPFRNFSKQELATVSLEQALHHPTWKMGRKITVDSSTLMNKGLEMIEAHFLFDLPPSQLEVIIHPQSIIHSMVECVDGSVFAEMSEPSMVYPIQFALTYPQRIKSFFPPFDFRKNAKLEFFAPDLDKFPSLTYAYEALKQGGSLPCFLNAANEILVDRFLKKEISWQGIVQKLERLLEKHQVIQTDSLESIFYVDEEARAQALVE